MLQGDWTTPWKVLGLVEEINVMSKTETHNNLSIASKRCMDQGIYYVASCHVQKAPKY